MDNGLILGNYRPVPFQIQPGLESVFCVDTETTGMDVKIGHRIITMGVVELFLNTPIPQMIGREFEWKCNPGRASDLDAIKVHGITNEEAATFPSFSEQVNSILETLGGTPIVIFNAKFDKGFLDKEMYLASKPPIKNVVYDALELARAGLPHRAPAKLDDMMRHFMIKEEREIHGALKDARILAMVFRRMYDAAKTITKTYDDQMHFLTRKIDNETYLPIRADRNVKRPTPDELNAHNQFVERFLIKAN